MANKADANKAKEALANRDEAPQGKTIAQYLDAQKPAIQAALPRNMDVDRFARIVLTTVRQSPKLLGCDPMTLLAAVMQAAQLGLEPGNGLGECYLIPYGRKVSFQLGYRGVTKLAMNSGQVRSIYAEAVYPGDKFDVQYGTSPQIIHVPNLDSEGRGTFEAMRAVYAVARLENSETQFVVMTKSEIERHRDRYSKALQTSDTPWKDPLGAVEMAKKTVVLRLCKMLPLSAEVSRAFAADESVRQELSADMTMIPDAESERVPAKAIGAVEEANNEPAQETAQQPVLEEEPQGRYAVCSDCGATVILTDDVTEADVREMYCAVCGGQMLMPGDDPTHEFSW